MREAGARKQRGLRGRSSRNHRNPRSTITQEWIGVLRGSRSIDEPAEIESEVMAHPIQARVNQSNLRKHDWMADLICPTRYADKPPAGMTRY